MDSKARYISKLATQLTSAGKVPSSNYVLDDSGVTPSTYGSASQIPVFAVDSKGRITSASNVAVAGVSSFAYNTSTGRFTIGTADGASFTADVTLAPFSTTNLLEGSNQYFTTERARASISATGSLSYSASTGVMSFTQGNTDTISEGATNLYYTSARARGALSYTTGSAGYNSTSGVVTIPGTTSHISEGTNLYYTDARVRAAISGSTGVTYSNGVISIGQPVGTTDNVTFNNVTVSGTLTSDDITSTNITVSGNLTVSGTTTIVNSTTVSIADVNLELARNAATAAQANGAGLTVTGPATPATLTYSSSDDRWNLNKDLNIGRVYGTLTGAVTGNASTATALQTTRSFTATGDASWTVNFDGTTNVSAAITLANSGVTAGSYGSGTAIPVLTIDAKGRVTAASTSAVTIGDGAMTVTAGTGLTGGGQLGTANQTGASSVTITHSTSGVTAGTYNNVTVNTLGHVTSGSNVAYLTSYTESDTLATVTGRGASTSTAITINNTLTTSGNVAVGTTPSTFIANWFAIEVGKNASIQTTTADNLFLGFNSVYGASGYVNKTANQASGGYFFDTSGNAAIRYAAAQATAGAAISYSVPFTFTGSTGAFNATGILSTSLTSGTMFSHGSMTDALGWNASYGTYIGSTVGGTKYLYANGSFYDGSANRALLHAGNYNSYSPTLTGGNASGTWGINVTGNAGSASQLATGAVTTGPAYFRKNQTNGDYTTAALWTESYGTTTTGIAFHISGTVGKYLEMRTNGTLYWNSSIILNDSNYTSYALPLSGSSQSGSWLFNNMGNNHSTYTDFNSVPGHGAYYLQGPTNGPTGIAGNQFYGLTLGLGADYALSSYGTQLYWPRRAQNSDTYIYVRDKEGGTWTSWNKIKAGYADTAGSATDSSKLPLTGGTLSGNLRINAQLQVGQNTNGTAYIDAYSGYARFGRDSTTNGLLLSGENILTVQTNYGNIVIGPQNASWAHITTDRPRFYFGSSVTVNGDIQRYSDSATYWHTASAPRAGNSSLMYYQGFTLDANTMDSNSTGFTYSVNAPYTGPIARFSTGGGYDLWLNGSYGGGGNTLAFRTRNGDAGTYNSWRTILHDGNYTSYAAAASHTHDYATHRGEGTNFVDYSRYVYNNGAYSGSGWIEPSDLGVRYSNSTYKVNGNSGYGRVGYGMLPFYNWGGSNAGSGAPSDSTYTTGIDVGSHPSDQAYGFQIASNMWNVGLWTRSYNSGWTGWVRVLDSNNYNSYAPTLTGGGASGSWSITAARATRANGNLYIDDNYGNGIVGAYNSYRYQGVFAMGDSYKLPADGTSTGSLYGMAWSHPNAGGIAGNLSSHGLILMQNGGFMCALSTNIVASGNIVAQSDERLKTNWRDVTENFVAKLAEVKSGIYDRVDQEDVTQVGVGAQSLQKILPEAIITAENEEQTLSVNYGAAALVSAVELAKKVVEQEARIAKLEALVETLINKLGE